MVASLDKNSNAFKFHVPVSDHIKSDMKKSSTKLFFVITARIRRRGMGNIFSVCDSVHTAGGGGAVIPILPEGGKGTPIFPDGGKGYPQPSRWWGTSSCLMVGCTSILPDGGGCTPILTDGVVPPSRSGPRSGRGVPPIRTGWGYPPPLPSGADRSLATQGRG